MGHITPFVVPCVHPIILLPPLASILAFPLQALLHLRRIFLGLIGAALPLLSSVISLFPHATRFHFLAQEDCSPR